jgi:hypothetical protein
MNHDLLRRLRICRRDDPKGQKQGERRQGGYRNTHDNPPKAGSW